MSNLLEKISELEQQLVALKAEAEKEEKENKGAGKRWRANRGGDYWYVSDYGITIQEEDSRSVDSTSTLDKYHYDTHNYFQTEKEARKYASVLETERQLRKFADKHNSKIDWEDIGLGKYYLCYHYDAYSTSVNVAWIIREPRIIYFSSRKIAEQAIDVIGIDKIKEYLTYEW